MLIQQFTGSYMHLQALQAQALSKIFDKAIKAISSYQRHLRPLKQFIRTHIKAITKNIMKT